MSDRNLPVRPNLDQLKNQAKDLLRGVRKGEPTAIEEFNKYYPKLLAPGDVKLADAQLRRAATMPRAGRALSRLVNWSTPSGRTISKPSATWLQKIPT